VATVTASEAYVDAHARFGATITACPEPDAGDDLALTGDGVTANVAPARHSRQRTGEARQPLGHLCG
jgi:hypothetical protein